MSKRTISFKINGQEKTEIVNSAETLLAVIRERLGLTGTKSGCQTGECGACIVLQDGEPVNSCLVLASEVDGANILTVEGLTSTNGKMTILQDAFVKYGAVQCGYCTSGMLMTATSLLEKNPRPSRQEIKKALIGNLCRCTGYAKIITAIEAASQNIDRVIEKIGSNIGSSFPRTDVIEHVKGSSLFIDDIKFPDMVYGKILRSQYAHARILDINIEKAKTLDGVLAIATGDDVPRGYFGVDLKDQLVFARNKVRHKGEAVAAVAATTEAILSKALDKIEVRYEPLPEVLDTDASLHPDAPIIHERLSEYAIGFETKRYGNVCTVANVEYGDIESGFESADAIVKETYTTASQHQCSLETHGAIAKVDSLGRDIVWTSNQKPFAVRRYLAESLQSPISQFRVIASKVGGGFGGKLELNVEPYAVVLSRLTAKPVKIIYSREEEFFCTGGRHATIYTIETGVKNNGTITAQKINFVYDTGAYSGNGPTTSTLVCQVATGLYRVLSSRIKGRVVYTNKMNFGSFRGPSAPQTSFVIESHMDSLAKRIGMDPLEFRLKNLLRAGERTGLGQLLKNIDYHDIVEAAAKKANWQVEYKTNRKNSSSTIKTGIGMSSVFWLSGGWATSFDVKINEDGSVIAGTGANDMGTGYLYTSVPQIIAEELGLDFHEITIVTGDTDTMGYDHGIGGSRGVYTIGQVAKMAASKAKRILLEAAAKKLQTTPESLETKQGVIWDIASPSRKITFREIAYAEHMANGGPIIGSASYLPTMAVIDAERVSGLSFTAFKGNTIGCHIAIVEVDTATGHLNIKKYIAAHDVGRVINPMAAEGQIEGGVAQGIGFATLEEMVFDAKGVLLNKNLADYKLPTSMDVPDIIPVIREIGSNSGPHGAKGLGEPTMAPTAAAIANAIFNATGVKIYATPMTPERILFNLGFRRDGKNEA